ncbi:MAG: hypothetical protein GW855_07900 [Erythrobacter sp.]|nr:hypothetical protein [Erythrobacter sp.]NCQ62461.1 hypothetical protein [Alphaproteobacteria bacterium]
MTEKTLTDVDGIGAKTAKALKAAGIADIAALAAVDTANPPELKGFNGTPAWWDWAAAAKTLLPSEAEAATGPSATSEDTPAPDLPQEAAPLTPEAASVIASAEATPEEQKEGAGQPHPAGSAPNSEDPYDGPVLVVTGPKGGFRRAGFSFDATPRELTPADFGPADPGEEIEAARRFLAIYREPRLDVTLRHPDGSLIEIDPAAVEAVEAALSTANSEEEIRQAVASLSVAMAGERTA